MTKAKSNISPFFKWLLVNIPLEDLNYSPLMYTVVYNSIFSRLKSKYVESMLASLCQMQVKVYFSESQGERYCVKKVK